MALYARFGLEKFGKSKEDVTEKFKWNEKLSDLEQICTALQLKDIYSLEEIELLELETKTILLFAPIIEGRTNTKLETLAQECRDYLD